MLIQSDKHSLLSERTGEDHLSWHDQPEQLFLIIAMSATAEKESHRDRRLCCNLKL